MNPLTGLRPRIAVLVLGGVLLLAAVMMRVSADSVGGAYERAARSELIAIATTWEDGFHVSDLADPQLMQQRVARLKELNPTSTRSPSRGTTSTGSHAIAETGGAATGHAAAIDVGAQGYRDVRSAGGHHAEIHYPVGPGPGRDARAALRPERARPRPRRRRG